MQQGQTVPERRVIQRPFSSSMTASAASRAGRAAWSFGRLAARLEAIIRGGGTLEGHAVDLAGRRVRILVVEASEPRHRQDDIEAVADSTAEGRGLHPEVSGDPDATSPRAASASLESSRSKNHRSMPSVATRAPSMDAAVTPTTMKRTPSSVSAASRRVQVP